MKILQVTYRMERGGVETWLMNVLRRIDRSHYQMDFLVQAQEKCSYDDEILSLGAKIIRIRPGAFRPTYFRFLSDFRNVLRTHGPYDIVHAHNTVKYGLLMREAALAGVPVRIMHSHSMLSHEQRLAIWPLCFLGRQLMKKYATVGLGCSRDACTAMFGPGWPKHPDRRPLYYGIDLEPYRANDAREDVRQELGIPQDALVVGHVGRFSPIKNHDFIVDIAHEFRKQKKDNIWFLLVGEGPERKRIRDRLDGLDLSSRFVLTGLRSDVPRLLCAMNVFVLPSFSEGMGIALIEAQATGLPCVMTENLPQEIEVVDGLCHRLSLDAGVSVWANKILDSISSSSITQKEAFSVVEKSCFNIDVCVEELTQLYEKYLSENRRY